MNEAPCPTCKGDPTGGHWDSTYMCPDCAGTGRAENSITANEAPLSLTPPWAHYKRTGLSEMRPYVLDEELDGISVSEPDLEMMSIAVAQGHDPGGYIARNPKNHADQWYVAQSYFEENLEPANVTARNDAAELRAAIKEWAEAGSVLALGATDAEHERYAKAVEALHRLAGEDNT